jgi:translation initiation factor 5B
MEAEDQKLSKSQKKRQKKKQGKPEEATEPSEVPEPQAEEPVQVAKPVQAEKPPQPAQQKPPAKTAAGKKGKKVSAVAKAAKEARQKAIEEEERRKKEEEELKRKEEEEERKRQEEERLAKEEAERRKKELKEAKRLGLIKTAAQLEEERRNAEIRAQFIQRGLVKIDESSKQAVQELPTNKKKKQRNKQETLVAKPESVLESESESVPDSLSKPKTVEESSAEIAESWEDMMEESKQDTVHTPKEDKVKESNEESTSASKAPSNMPARKTSLNEHPVPQIEEKQVLLSKKPKKKATDTFASDGPQSPYRSPIVCILGHVDTGKTKLLDKLRKTNVQLGEAGGITQQIGATMFPSDKIKTLVDKLGDTINVNVEVPGLLIIDTPGHESFTNLRSRGSSLCDLAVLVVDIMHGLEQQTIESLNMLKKKRIPFVVALNKIDRLYTWKVTPDNSFRDSFSQQQSHVWDEFRRRVNQTIAEFAQQEVNAAVYYENPDPKEFIHLIPTSAITGEGIPDLLALLVQKAQTELSDRILYKETLQATVLEVKVTEGFGATIDVILANGELEEGDTIIVAGTHGPIVTNIRALLTPQPLREMRVKGEYIHHSRLRGAIGVKISAPGLETALAGSQLMVARTEDELEEAKEEVQGDLNTVLNNLNKSGEGVHVQASTVGSLEALLEFLKESEIPVNSVSIGPVFKKDIIKAQSQLEKGNRKEFATVLAFDVKITPEAQEYAQFVGVKIFSAEIIYHLFDNFTAYVKEIKDQEKHSEGKGRDAIFPCALKIVEVFRTSNPIVLGVEVLGGILKLGTPLVIPDKGNLHIGKVGSIELNHKPQDSVRTGQVAIRITPTASDHNSIHVGRHFDETNQVSSWLTRASIDALKEYYKDEMTSADWKLVKVLKTTYGIV